MTAIRAHAKQGFLYRTRVIRADGRIEPAEDHNLTTIEGLTHKQAVTFKGATQVPTWYLGLYEGNYTPTDDVTAATLPGLATECTAYVNATRTAFDEGAAVGGSVDNIANPALFEFTQAKTIYGGFMSSASAKGAVSGLVMSAVRFASPKLMEPGDKLEVIAEDYLVSE